MEKPLLQMGGGIFCIFWDYEHFCWFTQKKKKKKEKRDSLPPTVYEMEKYTVTRIVDIQIKKTKKLLI